MAVLLSDAETAECADCAADLDLYGASWPRPVPAGPALWLVPDQDGGRDFGWEREWGRDPDRTDGAGTDGAGTDGAGTDGAGAAASPMVRAGADVARRRARRATVRRRRRAVALATVAAGLVCGLALPLASLAGSPVRAHLQAQPRVAGETVYVVRPGDTLWSIAARLDHGGDPRAMAEALAAETGSAVVVPGERIPIP